MPRYLAYQLDVADTSLQVRTRWSKALTTARDPIVSSCSKCRLGGRLMWRGGGFRRTDAIVALHYLGMKRSGRWRTH